MERTTGGYDMQDLVAFLKLSHARSDPVPVLSQPPQGRNLGNRKPGKCQRS